MAKKKHKKERGTKAAREGVPFVSARPVADGPGAREWTADRADISPGVAAEAADAGPGAWLEGVTMPAAKEKISLRLDADILAWFRGLGPRYQTRINAVLRAYYEQERHRRPAPRR